MDLLKTITVLANMRNQRDIPVAVIAERSGLAKSTIRNLESRRKEPTWEELTRYAQALNFKPTVVLNELKPPLALYIAPLLEGNTRMVRNPASNLSKVPLTGGAHMRTTLLTGEVGIGKTWLLARIIDQIHEQSNIILADPRGEVFSHLQRFRSPAVQALQITTPGVPQINETSGSLHIGNNAHSRVLTFASEHTEGFQDPSKPTILALDNMAGGDIQHAIDHLDGSRIDGLLATTPVRNIDDKVTDDDTEVVKIWLQDVSNRVQAREALYKVEIW